MSFLALFISLPTKASTGRMRAWRSVKALGCATLRDGVYLLYDALYAWCAHSTTGPLKTVARLPGLK